MANLSSIFAGIGAKRLSQVEVNTQVSHQHEFNGVTQFKHLLGNKKSTYLAKFIFLQDNEGETLIDNGYLTWYDARENHPTRSEYRMYFSGNQVIDNANEGDLLLIGKLIKSDALIVIVAKKNSTLETQLLWLFQLGTKDLDTFFVQSFNDLSKTELEFASKIIIKNIDESLLLEEKTDVEGSLIQKYADGFPSTKELSELAYDLIKDDIDAINNPDESLILLWEKELSIFKMLEKNYVEKVIRVGFQNVDDFLGYSLKIQNTRKSRAGKAFENHLARLFAENHIKYDNNKVTENNCKPDFIFPGITCYHDSRFPNAKLTMLGVKTTCKDRWRQILSEAVKIRNKHLATLEPSISENQTYEMKVNNITLVLPSSLHQTYTVNQQKDLMTIKDFIQLVHSRQS